MNDLKLKRKEIKDENGDTIRLVYNETEDILDIFFNDNEPATGIELTDHILLRLDKKTGRAISLTLLHFSILMERTEYGPRSYPLDKLEELPEDLRGAGFWFLFWSFILWSLGFVSDFEFRISDFLS
ncbi:MAG: hypothetical protein NT166_31635 [Candidatus Aminicenantes bacterium]|nr:hypothetical protein [Candidatus Aminicenantes bacterium]